MEKRRTDVYTVMLMISFGAIVTACLLLSMELARFSGSPPWNTSSAQPAAAP